LRIRPANEDEYDWRDFTPSSERDSEAMLSDLQGYRERITNPYLRALVDAFFTDQEFVDRFRLAPAARRVHHDYLGGLLEHTVDMLTLARAVLEVYPQIDQDLLITGVLLQDVGKLREFNWEPEIISTDEGQLIGHIVLTYEMVVKAMETIPEFPEALAVRIKHMLVAHQGRYEWGSPRRPQTLEAIALHHLENMSAQINRFQLLIENRPSGEVWTPYDRLLGRQLYAGYEDDLNVEEQGWVE
jgi:3'-5' exoribonuclease